MPSVFAVVSGRAQRAERRRRRRRSSSFTASEKEPTARSEERTPHEQRAGVGYDGTTTRRRCPARAIRTTKGPASCERSSHTPRSSVRFCCVVGVLCRPDWLASVRESLCCFQRKCPIAQMVSGDPTQKKTP